MSACRSNSEFEKHNLDEILLTAHEVFDYEFPNIDLSRLQNQLNFREVEKLYSFEVQQISHEFDNFSPYYVSAKVEFIEFMTRFGSTPNENEIIFTAFDGVFEYHDLERNLLFSFYRDRTFIMMADDIDKRMIQGGQCVSFSLIQEDTVVNDLVPIEGFSPEDALELVKDTIWNEILLTISDEDISFYSIATFKRSDGTYAYHIILAKEMKGLNLSESGEFIHVNDGFIRPTFVSLKIDGNGEIYYVVNFFSNVYEEDSFAEIEDGSFISLLTALNLLSDYLAPYNVYEVEKIDLVYFLPTRFSGDMHCSNLMHRKYIPGFEITLANNTIDEVHMANLTPRKTAFVDIVTGDIYISDSIRHERFFIMP
jgi:hypothetical protein